MSSAAVVIGALRVKERSAEEFMSVLSNAYAIFFSHFLYKKYVVCLFVP